MSRSVLTLQEIIDIITRGEIVYYKGRAITNIDDPDLPVSDAQILDDYPNWSLNPSAYASANAVGIDGFPIEGTPINGQTLVFNSVNKTWEYGAGSPGTSSTTLTGDVTGTGVGTVPTTITNLALTKLSPVTANRAIISNGSGVLSVSNVTSTELGYVSGVTSSIQTQLDSKMATSIYDPNGDGYIDNSIALKIIVHNMTGNVVPKGSIVYINGATGTHPTIALAQANAEMTSSKTIGAVVNGLAIGEVGEVIVQGVLDNQDTKDYVAGDVLWLSPTIAGGVTTTKPVAPNHAVFIGYVVRANANNGRIVYRILNGFEVHELHDVLITNTPAAGQLLIRNATASLWENANLTAGNNITITNADKSVTINATNRGSSNVWFPASAWSPRATGGCGVASRELPTNQVNLNELLFDPTSVEYAQSFSLLPNNYNNGTITARFYWTASSGSGAVVWGLRARAYGDSDALDQAKGTGQTVTDSLASVNSMNVSTATPAITIAGTPNGNKPIHFEVYRLATDSADTLTSDASLIGVEITYTIS